MLSSTSVFAEPNMSSKLEAKIVENCEETAGEIFREGSRLHYSYQKECVQKEYSAIIKLLEINRSVREHLIKTKLVLQ